MNKQWYRSKAIWGGLLVFLGGGLVALGMNEWGTLLITTGTGLGFVGLRLAK